MSLNIELAAPDMATLTKIALAEGREPAECATSILQSALASKVHELDSSRNLVRGNGQQSPRETIARVNAHALAGKYKHLNVSTETLRQARE